MLKNFNKENIIITKAEDGSYRILGIYSNKFIDRDEEILSSDSHKEYIEWAESTGFNPVITVLHAPKFPAKFWIKLFESYGNEGERLNTLVRRAIGKFIIADVEKIFFINGFVAVDAKVREDKLDVIRRLQEKSDLGMSHGFVLLEKDGKVFNKYRTFEMSILERDIAANIFTVPIITGKTLEEQPMGNKQLSEEHRQYLTQVYGEDAVSMLEDQTKEMQEIMEQELDFKDKLPEEEKSEEMADNQDIIEEKSAEESEEDKEEDEDEENMDKSSLKSEIVAEVVKAMKLQDLAEVLSHLLEQDNELSETVKDLSDRLDVLKHDIDSVKKSHDERVAEEFTVPEWKSGYSPSQDSKTIQKDSQEEKELTENAPDGTRYTDFQDNPIAQFLTEVTEKSGMINR